MADTKLSALVELAATPANDDELYIRDVSEAAADESKRITVTNLIAAVTGYAKIGSGTYVGDDSVNKTIAHGLGVTPKLVFLIVIGNPGHWTLMTSTARVCFVDEAAAVNYAVTVMDSTNFYVGNATQYLQSGNGNGSTYYWVAMG